VFAIPRSEIAPSRKGAEGERARSADDGSTAEQVPPALLWGIAVAVLFIVVFGGILISWHFSLETQSEAKAALARGQANLPPQGKDAKNDSASKGAEPPPTKEPSAPVSFPEKALQPPKVDEPKAKAPDVKPEVPAENTKPVEPARPVETAKKDEPARPAPQDEITIGGDGWFELNCLRGRFRVALPGVPALQAVEGAGGADAFEYVAKNAAGNLVFRAGAAQLTGAAAAAPWREHLEATIAQQLSKPAMQMLKDQDIVHDGQRGREFLAEGLGKNKVAGRYFRLEDISGHPRILYFTIAGTAANLEGRDPRKFLQSVKLMFTKSGTDLAKENPGGDKKTSPGTDASAGNTAKKEPDAGKKGPTVKVAEANSKTPVRPAAPPPPSRDVGKFAGKLNAHLGAVIDPEASAALLLLASGQAKLFDYPDFKPLGSYKLGAGPAYRAVYEKSRGRLFALSPGAKGKDTAGKDTAGKPGGSQLAVYEIRALLEGKVNAHAEIAPVKTIQLGGFCSQLCLPPDGSCVYALDTTNPKAIKAVRANLESGKIDGAAAMPEFTEGLSLARDGRILYALSHLTGRTPNGPPPEGAVLVIDPIAMKVIKTVSLPIDPFTMQATKAGVVFVSGHGGVRSEIVVVDINKEMPIVASWKGVPPGSCLKLSEDEQRLYVGKWKGAPPAVGALVIPEALAGSELPAAEWSQYPPLPARGDLFITPDNHYLVCDSGVVFFLKGAD
jgi:outer membrane biosynthesis protein TonB